MSNEMNTQEEKKVLTQKDLNKAMFRWYMSAEMPLNFENMQGIAFCGSISHILKKLYTKKEDLSEALKRHLLLYNCNVTAGGLILGTTIAMEEQRAKDRRNAIPRGECIYFDEAYERGMKLLGLDLAKLDVNMFAAMNNSLINDGCGLFRGRLILPYEHLSRFQNDLID